MSQFRSIKDFFKRPKFALDYSDETPGKPCDNPGIPTQQPERIESITDSPSPSENPIGAGTQLRESLARSGANPGDETGPQQSFQSVGTTGNSSVGDSFHSSQRVMKNGKEIVKSSDSEDTESVESLEDVDDMLMRFTGAKPEPAKEKTAKGGSAEDGRSLRSIAQRKSDVFELSTSVPKYKFTLGSLVTDAVDDNEIEAGVAKARAAADAENAQDEEAEMKIAPVGGADLREDMLASALGDENDDLGLQRLLDAVRRTDAFDHGKSWSFFGNGIQRSPAPEFPHDPIVPVHWAGLREPSSRKRAFQSGIIDLALSRDHLPDELVLWIFRSVPSEPREELRKAYCRAFKVCCNE